MSFVNVWCGKKGTFDVTNFFKNSVSLMWLIWTMEKEVNNNFNMSTAVKGVSKIVSKFAFKQMT